MSACSDNQSTILPFPSSPHWAPPTTTLAIRRYSLCNPCSYEHGPAEQPVFPGARSGAGPSNHAPSPIHGRGRSNARRFHRIKDAGDLGKQEGGRTALKIGFNLLISRGKSVTHGN